METRKKWTQIQFDAVQRYRLREAYGELPEPFSLQEVVGKVVERKDIYTGTEQFHAYAIENEDQSYGDWIRLAWQTTDNGKNKGEHHRQRFSRGELVRVLYIDDVIILEQSMTNKAHTPRGKTFGSHQETTKYHPIIMMSIMEKELEKIGEE